jgi:hypothetical protein
MATLPTSPNVLTRNGPTFQGLAEANQQLQGFIAQPGLFGCRFNEPPPPYYSRSPTPHDSGPEGREEDDPALLLALERNARTFVANWERYRNEAMTQEEKEHELALRNRLRQQIATRKREEEEDFQRLLAETRLQATGIFGQPVSRDAEQLELHANTANKTTRKRKRETEDLLPPSTTARRRGRPRRTQNSELQKPIRRSARIASIQAEEVLRVASLPKERRTRGTA